MSGKSRNLGQVKITQVQPAGIKVEGPGGKIYDPSRRISVPLMHLTAHGVEGETGQAERLLDIHHADHPKTRNNGRNAISIGFTSHYQMMRTRFGNHLQDGTAGENIIIDCNQEIWLADLGQKVEFHNPDSGNVVTLDVVKTAAPCDEFCQYAASSQDERLVPSELKEILQFLKNGRRGFLLILSADQDVGLVQPGDLVYAIG